MEDKDKQGEKKWYILDRGSLSLLIVLLAAILFYVGLTNFDVIAVRVRTFMGVLTPFIAGFAIAYLLNTPMCFFERKLYQKQKHRRGLAILTVYLIALAIVVVLLNLIIPQVAQSVVDLATNMQTYLTSLNSLVQTLSEQFGLEAEALPCQPELVCGRQGIRRSRERCEIGISSVRGGGIVGDHEVLFAGRDELIELRHSALSREVFASGAVQAARFLAAGQSPGLYSMADLVTYLGL